MIKSYKVKLKLNNKQKTHLVYCANVSRWAYNWALGQEKENYELNKDNPDKKTHFINNFDLRKRLTYLKKNNDNYKWLYDYDCDIVKQSIKDAEKSFLDFFKHKTGFPKFKSKRKSKPSFFIDNIKIKIDKHGVKIPRLKSIMKFYEKDYIPINDDNNNINNNINNKPNENKIIKYSNPRITSDGINWYLSVGIELNNKNIEENEKEISNLINNNNILGIDLGLKELAACSNGKTYSNNNKSKKLKLLRKRQRRLQKKISKKYEEQKKRMEINNNKSNNNKSDNRNTNNKIKIEYKKGEKLTKTFNIVKSENKLKKTYIKISNIQRDYFNKVVLEIVKTKPSKIVLEDLNIRGMQKNKHLSKSIQESSLYLFRTLLTNKCKEYNIEIINADRFYPSSKLCSNCGNIKEDLKLKVTKQILKLKFAVVSKK
ncbi:MAG: transposase [Bacteroidales bacterium]|jgi:putative transposase|nr:transposase [Bacteroidales bacterium]